VATGILEDTAEQYDLEYRVESPIAEILEPSPDAFLVAAFPLAAWHRERRVIVEGPVSPMIRDSLRAFGSIIRDQADRCTIPRIESRRGFQSEVRAAGDGTWCLFSGGVDSLALFRANRLDYPLDHDWAIKNAIFLFGLNNFDFDRLGVADPERQLAFGGLTEVYRPFLEEHGCRLHPVWTNVRCLSGEPGAWGRTLRVAGTTAIAHALIGQGRALYASDGTGQFTRYAARHDAAATLLSSESVAVHTTELVVSRLQKLAMLADWPGALDVLRVCFWQKIPGQGLNCGYCAKCVRTMLELIAIGHLQDATCFPRNDLTRRDLGRVRRGEALYLGELVKPLRAQGRADLACELERRLAGLRLRRWIRRISRTEPAFWRRQRKHLQ
jgi:hypothetical protein